MSIKEAPIDARLYNKMRGLFLGVITSLTRAIDAKDNYTNGHSERVMKYTVAIGREMGLEGETLESLRLASLLHDIGKIGIKESILIKPAKLLGYERRQIKMHPSIGARIIESMDDSDAIRRGILEHHERYDGKGYPNRLKGKQISIEGRIIAVADVFDALTTDRPYQKGYSREEVFRKIEGESASQFDPQVVAAFAVSYKNHPEIWKE
jgi:putative nucleotidyltransferase with HDIG domain